MQGAIYLLSRKVNGDNGESYMQNVTVFASNPEHARTIVNEQFTRLRLASKSKEAAYQVMPTFAVEKVALDEHKMITAGVTV
jgi:glycerol-3-phosphate dehydrogenase